MAGKIFLKRGKERPLLQHHPWIFSGAIQRAQDAQDGETVEVYDAAGQWLARAGYNSRSQIAARVWSNDQTRAIDATFFQQQLRTALQLRTFILSNRMGSSENPRFDWATALRLVNAESDGLPGVIVDRYADFLVVQFLTLAAELHKEEIAQALLGASPVTPLLRGIYERSDVDVRRKEGLAETTGVLAGEEPPAHVEIIENGLSFLVDVKRGHKTGFYLDQRVNRERAVRYLRGEVLNAFAYTGAFGVYAAVRNDGHVTNLDASASALELARANFERNGVTANAEYVAADAFQKLREYRTAGRSFDAIVLDPPKFVTSQANLERAARGYKDLNLLALQLLRPGGYLVTFSCSGLVSPDLFQKIVFGASVDAFKGTERGAQIIDKLGQSPDHPFGLNFPEGEYLKGLILRVI